MFYENVVKEFTLQIVGRIRGKKRKKVSVLCNVEMSVQPVVSAKSVDRH